MTTEFEQRCMDTRERWAIASLEKRHAGEMALRQEELRVGTRLRAFEMVKPFLLNEVDNDKLGESIAVAERLAQWALTGGEFA